MKNNTMAMLAIIAIAMSLASLIGYIEPGTCTIAPAQGIASCEQAAVDRLWGFVGLLSFGVITLAVGTFRQRRQVKRDRQIEPSKIQES